MMIPKAAVINDLSGFGKCSLTAAIPILSAMGVQACPLATGVLSNQTGFPSFSCVDLTDTLIPFSEEWKKLQANFQTIFTGFLCDVKQVEFIEQFIKQFRSPDTLVLVDPVLGDGGALYPAIASGMCDAMRTLVAQADVITPNFTEACLLTGCHEYHPDCISQAWEMAEELHALGPNTVVITGIHQGGDVVNALSQKNSTKVCVGNRKVGQHSYSGTGDILASILCGGLTRGLDAQDALRLAAHFLEAAIAESELEGTDPAQGVALEHHIKMLVEAV